MASPEAVSFDPLFSGKVKAILAELPAGGDALEIAERVRRDFEPDLARRVAELHRLRVRATDKFGPDVPFFFTRKAFEQASPRMVSGFRAARIAERTGQCDILDATCGMGADSLAFARAGLFTISADLDAFLLRCARENLRDAGFEPRMILADAARPAMHAGRKRGRADHYFADPDRRSEGTRTSDSGRWSPTLSGALEAASHFAGASIKLPPGLELERTELPERASLSWVSRERQLYEVTLWLGNLVGETRREAVLLDAQGEAVCWSATPAACPALSPAEARDIGWIAEADPAVLRAGLLGNLALDLGLAPLASQLAYLGGRERPPATKFGRSWPVLGVTSVHPRPVRALLAQHDIGPLTVKKRGHPEDAESLAKRLRGKGRRPGLLFVARLEDGHAAYLVGPEERAG